MTPNSALNPIDGPKPIQAPSTLGMTTKVVKGSLWTLAGQIAPFAVAFVSTPFTIRFLGSEAYGVLILIGLIPGYFAFADFGMGFASTKFGSESYSEGNHQKEREIVWTATAVAAISTIIVATPLFFFSNAIVTALNVPDHLIGQASTGLKITSAAFVFAILASVINSPILARLRMDLNTVTQAVPKILLSAVTPIILYYGGGIVGAVSWAFLVGVAACSAAFFFSGWLLPGLFRPTFNRRLLRPLLHFGGGWFVAMVAAMLLVNLEKFFLTKMVSVQALAYYSVAFTVASMAAIFSQSMIQSLIPAFSQLQTPQKRSELNTLFARGIRLNIIWLLPAMMVMFVAAEPFFTLWAGEEFGRESTIPFYVLLAGLFFNVMAYIPLASVIAAGRTDIFARLYWIELALYAVAAWALIIYFGIIGAALAWSLRVTLDAFVIIRISKQVAGTSFDLFAHFGVLVLASIALLIPAVLSVLQFHPAIVVTAAAVSLAVYAVLIWTRFVEPNERVWLVGRFRGLLKRQ